MTAPAWLPPPQPPRSWPARHPALTALGGLFAVGFVLAYWYLVIPIALVAGGVALWWGRQEYRRREHARLAAAADQAYRTGDVLPPRPPWENGGTMGS